MRRLYVSTAKWKAYQLEIGLRPTLIKCPGNLAQQQRDPDNPQFTRRLTVMVTTYVEPLIQSDDPRMNIQVAANIPADTTAQRSELPPSNSFFFQWQNILTSLWQKVIMGFLHIPSYCAHHHGTLNDRDSIYLFIYLNENLDSGKQYCIFTSVAERLWASSTEVKVRRVSGSNLFRMRSKSCRYSTCLRNCLFRSWSTSTTSMY